MPASISPQDFVAKWTHATLKEHAAAQSHFNDLCALIGHPTPSEADPAGTWFTYEAGATKQAGGQGWADVWKRGCFAWEYKGKDGNLDKAYQQLLQYREALLNPPLLVVCDINEIRIHTNFTNTVKQIHRITLVDLLKPEKLSLLRRVFTEPDSFKAPQTTEQVTETAAAEFAHLAQLLVKWGAESHAAAHFLIRILFCLFAEDVDLLPKGLFTRLLTQARRRPALFRPQLTQLFQAMMHGGTFGVDEIRHFDGGLFDDTNVLDMDSDALDVLARVSELDWSSIKPSIFGTLFERSLDPSKRGQLGAHFTGEEDILLVVEPVLMAPLRRRWAEIKAQAEALAVRRDAAQGAQRTRLANDLFALLRTFRYELAAIRVLDAACGSGNFLYVALRLLLDLEKEVINLAKSLGDSGAFPAVSPEQLYGIEINPYAHELAQVTVWIGYIQWLRENGFGEPSEPILKPLNNILCMDAILTYDEQGNPVEPEWPEAYVIVGNPPFLGGKRLRSGLGDPYVDALFALYDGRVPREADLVTYWFEKAREQIAAGKAKRAGLLATQGIRGGANRRVLERIKGTGDIFWAQSDRDWILDGAAVHVSMVGFDDGSQDSRELDGKEVSSINANLKATADVTLARRLPENGGLSFMGVTPAGPFDIPESLAREWMALPLNPNGRPNSDVLHPYYNGIDLTRRPRGVWIIDFGVGTPLEQASLYEVPFEYVLSQVKPKRMEQRSTIREWWLHERPRRDMRAALQPLQRYVGTSMVSKHLLFSWVSAGVVPANLLIVVARDDDYFFGVLHSRPHELWARAMGTQLREVESGFRYTPTTTFETFAFPWPPGQEPAADPHVWAIAQAAQELVQLRDAWLNPPGASEADLKKRTLTNLYNQRPTWLDNAHKKLDAAVFAAYGWSRDLTDEEVLERLLALNLERAASYRRRPGG
jgi:type II restriction/modification system DNA methylase subunit YeeA